MAKTEAELARPLMTDEERLARMIARGEFHNNDEGRGWERYRHTARLILRHCLVVFQK